jgi:hypothetical protein
MECFGRPNDQSPTVWWLHITGWAQPPAVRPRNTFMDRYPTPMYGHHVALDPATTPVMETRLSGRKKPTMAFFHYWADNQFGGLTVDIYVGETGEPVGCVIPDWLHAISDEHRPHAHEHDWCRLSADTKSPR